MFRGTLRYPGWCATMKAAADLGLFEIDEQEWPQGTTYAQVVCRRLPASNAPLPQRVAAFTGTSTDSEVLARLEWAGLLSDRPIPERRASPLDIFGNRLMRLMMYQPGERDMVMLQHTFTVTYPDKSQEEIRSTLVETGEPWGDTAMARTVSLPAAIAARLDPQRRHHRPRSPDPDLAGDLRAGPGRARRPGRVHARAPHQDLPGTVGRFTSRLTDATTPGRDPESFAGAAPGSGTTTEYTACGRPLNEPPPRPTRPRREPR